MQTKKFSFDTISEFDKHINSSVSNYEHIPYLIKNLSTYFIEKGTNVYDLGCSTGLFLKELKEFTKVKDVSFVGYDISENLLPKESDSYINFYKQDITQNCVKFFNTNLMFSMFTLQFIPTEQRVRLMKKIYDSLNDGGAFIITEKIFLKEGRFQDIFCFTHYDFKRETFTGNEILSKQKDLRSFMRPQSDEENIQMFKNAGFKSIETFYQSLNFKGYIMIK